MTPLMYEMLKVLLDKGETVMYVHSKLKKKPRQVVKVEMDGPDHDPVMRVSYRVLYTRDGNSQADWRKLSVLLDVGRIDELAALVQEKHHWEFQVNTGETE